LSPNIIFDVAAFLLAISVHESAHAWSAWRLGDDTARLLGRVSLNPLRHIDPIGTVLFPLLGALSGLPVFGWAKPTPVELRRLNHPQRDWMLVSAAGPASNFAVALVAVAALIAIRKLVPGGPAAVGEVSGGTTESSAVLAGVATLFYRFLLINVLLGVFNLIPVPPLDGSNILAGVLPAGARRVYAEIGRFGFVLLLLLLLTDIPFMLFLPVLGLFHSLLRL
jgi:Zn-dependent protease